MLNELFLRAASAAASTVNIDDPSLNISKASNSQTLDTLFGTVTTWVALVAGILAFIYLIYSGILYLTSAGNADSAKKGQQGILNAIIGIVIIIAAWAIVSAVTNQTTTSLGG